MKTDTAFTPFGMKGSKLVNDYLKDKKVEPIERHQQLVVTDAKEQIIWLVGRTIDERVKVREDTKKIMKVEITGDEDRAVNGTAQN